MMMIYRGLQNSRGSCSTWDCNQIFEKLGQTSKYFPKVEIIDTSYTTSVITLEVMLGVLKKVRQNYQGFSYVDCGIYTNGSEYR